MSNGRPVALWKSWWIRATALVVLVCLAGFAWFVVGDRAKPAPSTASLGLRVIALATLPIERFRDGTERLQGAFGAHRQHDGEGADIETAHRRAAKAHRSGGGFARSDGANSGSQLFEFRPRERRFRVRLIREGAGPAELEQALHNARGTAFENPDVSRVSIGTIVTVRESDSKKEETYTILGAWDGDPERHIISYQTAIGQALLGHQVGEVVTLPNGQFAIISIEAAPPDETPPDPALMEIETASV